MPLLAQRQVAASLGASGNNPLVLTQYLSSSDGQTTLQTTTAAARSYVDGLAVSNQLKLNLTIDTSGVHGEDVMAQLVFSVLESQLPAHETLLGYFPADRALPTGDVQIQLGLADAAQQLKSHLAQPQLKFARFKTTIANTLLGDMTRQTLTDIFKDVFTTILPGKELGTLGINAFSAISIPIIETDTQREFDLDQMSSGEKGLLLGALLIIRSIAQGGILLLDEPELHLNPSVCRTMFKYIVEKICRVYDIQAIICTHSPQILDEAIDQEHCALWHLRDEKTISPINWRDRGEVFSALKRLGTSPSDELFFRGSIYVEGDDDVQLLQENFSNILYRYRLAARGGRGNIEGEIDALQKAEEDGKLEGVHAFIFDLDRTSSGRRSTPKVRILQWSRYCIENYLIEPEIIYFFLRDRDIAVESMETVGEALPVLKALAFEQIAELAARETFSEMNFNDPGLPNSVVRGASFEAISEVAFARLASISAQIGTSLDEKQWRGEYQVRCASNAARLRDEWENNAWILKCNGKRVFSDVQAKFRLKISSTRFKQRVLQEMRVRGTENWKLILTEIKSVIV